MIMNSYATFHDLWIQVWIHVCEEYHEIIPEIMGTKIPDEIRLRRRGARTIVYAYAAVHPTWNFKFKHFLWCEAWTAGPVNSKH